MTINLGTGKGYSVLDVLKAYEIASGREIAYKIVPRRDGDIARNYADPSYAKEILGWEAKRDFNQMCKIAGGGNPKIRMDIGSSLV